MGAKHSKKIYIEDSKSTSPVYEKSLSSKSKKNKNKTKNDNINEIIQEIKELVHLPIENENTKSPEIIFEPKHEIKIKNFLEDKDINIENEDDGNLKLNKFFPDDLFNLKRSKTFAPQPSILQSPHLQSKAFDNIIISPFKLSKKSFGIVPEWNQKPNKICLDFPQDKIDCKSCNDKDGILEEYLLYYSETEKTTPNLEDFQDLINCRKKMIKFRNSINYKHYHEYENILNCDDIFEDIQDNNENVHHSKKKSFWQKHIKYQLSKDKDKDKNLIHNQRLNSEPFPMIKMNFNKNNFNNDIEDENEDDKEKDDEDEDEGLFILGVIERAAKERKRTKSVAFK